MRIIIFGTGSTAERALQQINSEIEIIAVADNNKEKWNKLWNGYNVINPMNIRKYQYDYILVCSMFAVEIIESLMDKGIKRSEIIPYFKNYDWQEQIQMENLIRNKLIKQNTNKKIALLTRGNSGCNSRALFKNIPLKIKDNFSVSLIDLEEYKRSWNEYEIVFTTHMESRNYKSRFNIETWHGFPIKTIGSLEKNAVHNMTKVDDGIDYIISYSSLYSYIMSSVFKIDINKFIVTGMPRNDFLANASALELLSRLTGRDHTKGEKTIFYVPTFRNRKGKTVREGTKVFSYEDDFKIIDQYMEEIKGCFVIKKHRLEEDAIELADYKNICFLTDDDLQRGQIDFYEILGGSDILITDYSSVYFDYLLLNKPIIFWTKDQQVYEEKRGFLFDNIESMMPGPKVKTVSELIEIISKFMINSSWYSDERENINKLVNFYQDFNSTTRVWDLLLNIYNIT